MSERGQWTSASNAESDALCTGRHRAQLGLPDIQSDVADRGTRIHAYLHWKRTANDHLPPQLENDAELDLAMRCWDLEQEEKRLWLESIGGDHGNPAECLSEHRQWISDDRLSHSGQADAIYSTGPFVLILDDKTGFMEVPPPNENLQLRDLAVLKATNTPTLLHEVRVQIIRPFGKRQPPCVYDTTTLVVALEEMMGRVHKSNDPDARRTPNEISCRFCKAKGNAGRCPESQAAVVTLSKTAQELIAHPTAEFLDACTLAMSIAKQAQANARALLKTDPDAIPGYALEPNAPNRPIVDAHRAWDRAQAMGLTLDHFMDCVKIGKGDLEEHLKANYRVRTERERIPYAEWKEIMDGFYSGIVSEEAKEPSLKRV